MTVTLVGGFIIAFALLCYFFDGRRLAPAAVFFGSFSGTGVVNFGDYGMAPSIVFFLLLLLWKVTSGDIMRSLNVGRDHLILVLLIVLFATLSCVSLLYHTAFASLPMIQVTQTAYVLFGTFVTVVMSLELAKPDVLEAAVRALRLSAAFVAAWGVLQAVCFYTGIEYPAFLFNNSSSHFAFMFDQVVGNGMSRIASVAVEPSFMAISITIFAAFGSTVVVVEERLRTRAWLIPLVLTLLVLIASTSTTAYVGLALLALLLGVKRPSLILVVGLLGLLVGVVVIMALPSFGEALWTFTFGKGASGSYSERGDTIRHALQGLGQHLLLGDGWGSDFSFSMVSIMLANTGVLGTAVFVVGYGGTILASWAARQVGEGGRRGSPHWRTIAYAQGAENAMIVGIVQGAVSGFHFMVLDFWCLWALSLGITSCLVNERVRTSAVRLRHLMPGMVAAR